MIIVVDGPEKAGKSTFIEKLRVDLTLGGYKVRVRRWGPVKPDDRVYTEPLMDDTAAGKNTVVVWDRSWASESVYSTLLDRKRRLQYDPFLGEWLHGRAVNTVGLRLMLLGPSAEVLSKRRDITDLPVDPAVERHLFDLYAQAWGWKTAILATDTDNILLSEWVQSHLHRNDGSLPLPPHWAGPWDADTVVVGQQPKTIGSVPGAWLPYTESQGAIDFGRLFIDHLSKVAWTYMESCPPQMLRTRKLLISTGPKATAWVKQYVGKTPVELQSPNYLMRASADAVERRRDFQKLLTALGSL